MTVVLVTYDLEKPKKDYPAILDIIKKYDYLFVTESSYLVNTTDVSKLWEELHKSIDATTRLCIFGVSTSMVISSFPDSSETKLLDAWMNARIS